MLNLLAGEITGFVFGSVDIVNKFYMHQISCDGPDTPNNVRWHTKSGGWAVDPKPFLSRL